MGPGRTNLKPARLILGYVDKGSEHSCVLYPPPLSLSQRCRLFKQCFRGSVSGEVAGWRRLPCGCRYNVNPGSNTAVTGGRA